MGDAVKKSFESSASGVQTFDKSLQSLNSRISAVNGELTALSIGGAALTGFGLRAADNLRVLNIRFVELTGSQEKASALMQEIADAAQRTGLPVRQTQADFLGLVPAIREAGGEIDTYLNLVSRLALINPAEGTSGATFAIREALTSGGSDLVSLAERFNISRVALKELIQETGSFSEALDILLDRQGATTEAAEANARSLRAASARFRDAGTQALERGFTPFVDKAASALDTLTTAINAAPDGLVQIGAGAAIAVTGFASMTLAVSQLLTSYQNLQKAGFFTNMASVGKNIARAGVLAGAVAVGSGIGVGVTRGIGAATGDERLQNFGIRDAIKPLRETIALIVDLFLQLIQQLARVFARIIAFFLNIPNSLDSIRGQLEGAFGAILVAMAAFLRFIPGQGENAENLRTQGETNIANARTRIDAAQQRANDNVEALDQAAIEGFEAMRLEVLMTIGGMSEEVEAEVTETTEIIKQGAKDGMEVIEQQNEAYLAGLQSRISFEQQYIELLREGTPEQVEDRIQSLKDEKAAIEQFLPQLEQVAQTSSDAAESLAEYEARLAEIDDQSAQLGTALLAATERAIAATNTDIGKLDTDFAAEVAKIESERQKALNEAFDDLKKNLGELDADVLKKSRELGAENIEALEEYQDREREIVAEHRERVLQIESKSREDILDAASRLDAAGVASARRQREEQLTEADKQLNEERNKNAAKLAETQKNLAQEAAELQAYYVERRNQLIAENQADIVQLNEKFNAELQTAETAYQQERAKLQQHLAQLVGMRISASAQEANAVRQGLQATQQAVAGFVNNLANQASRLKQAASALSGIVTQNAVSSGVPSSPTTGIGASSAAMFATGGVASFRGNGSAMAFVENKERILTPSQNANFERFVNAISGAGPASPQAPIAPDNIAVDVTGVDSFEALVARVTRNVIGQIYSQRLAGTPS